MADQGIRISDLPELLDTDYDDLLVIVDSSEPNIDNRTKRVRLSNLTPVPFVISNFAITPNVATFGQVLTSVIFTFGTNKTADSLTISGGVGSVTSSPHLALVNITSNTSYILTATKDSTVKTAGASITYANHVYYGTLATDTPSAANIEMLTSQLSNSKGRSVVYDCSGGKYFYYVFPKRLGSISSALVNNISWNDWVITSIDITNEYGYVEPYWIYRSYNLLNGSSISVVWN